MRRKKRMKANIYNTWWIAASLAAAIVAGLPASAVADTIYLKRGGSLNGKVVEGETTIELRMDGGSATFNKNEIERIEQNGIQREPSQNTVSGTLSRWSAKASRTVDQVKHQAQDALSGKGKAAKKSGQPGQKSGLLQPIQRSAAARQKEQMLNDSMAEMQKALQKKHQQDRAISKQKRELKKEGFNIS